MSIQAILSLQIPLEVYSTEESKEAQKEADQSGWNVYSWISEGKWNKLQKGYHLVNNIGLVVLPNELPNTIHMPDDKRKR